MTREEFKESLYRHGNAAIARQRYRETSETLDRQWAYDKELYEIEEALQAHDAAQREQIRVLGDRLRGAAR